MVIYHQRLSDLDVCCATMDPCSHMRVPYTCSVLVPAQTFNADICLNSSIYTSVILSLLKSPY
jgi:hypothetical protein